MRLMMKSIAQRLRDSRLSYADVMATFAAFLAMGGGAYALALGENSVQSKHIKDGHVKGVDLAGRSVSSSKVKDESLLAEDFAGGQLPPGPTGPTGAQGPKGDPGPPGSIAGSPAGGALSGVYPNPRIAPGAVGPAALSALPGAHARATAPQTINTIEGEYVALDQEIYDTGNIYTAPDDAIRVGVPGTYVVVGNIGWESGSGMRTLAVFVQSASSSAVDVVPAVNNGSPMRQTATGLVRLSAGDMVRLHAGHSAGAPGAPLDTTFIGGAAHASLSVAWIGP